MYVKYQLVNEKTINKYYRAWLGYLKVIKLKDKQDKNIKTKDPHLKKRNLKR